MFSVKAVKSLSDRVKAGPSLQAIAILTVLAVTIVAFPAQPQAFSYPDAFWRGEYYNNRDLSGDPALVRDDGNIDFYWGFGVPGDNAVSKDNFSVRWTRNVHFEGGTYKFYAVTDDGVRLWVDEQVLIDRWGEQAAQTHEVSIDLVQGWHHVRVEYFELGGVAEARVWWDRTTVALNPANWRGEYYDNTSLAGSPLFVRDDGGSIDFDWGFGSPGGGLTNDSFSVRWTRGQVFQAGDYHFYVINDDGVKFWVDDHLLVNEWYDQTASTHKASISLGEGWHQLKMEYYENGQIAKAKLWWERVQPQVQAQVSAQQSTEPYPTSLEWRGEYYSNPSLSGSPTFVRGDGPGLDWDWQFGGPGGGLANDNFSIRWTRSMSLEGGSYRFTVTADDGVKLWVDDQLPINEWRVQAARTFTADVTLVAGWHELKLEYYESGGVAEVSLAWDPVETYPVRGCSIWPVLGFGTVWTDMTVRANLGCPTDVEMGIWSSEQLFQGGYMFWREDLRHIYVLYNNGTWQMFTDTWETGDPAYDPNIVPPSGLYQPQFGFGKVWREQPGVRDGLGWATMAESSFWASIEPFENGLMIWSPTEGVFVLYNDGTWGDYL